MLETLAGLPLVTLVCAIITKQGFIFIHAVDILLTWQYLLKQQVQDDTRTEFRMHFRSACIFNQPVITAFFSQPSLP